MDSCDVLIVGAGPAGSSCAWALRQSGLDVVILDKQVFPRDKICGGWITPEVLAALEIDAREYGSRHVLQPITGFKTCALNGPSTIETHFNRAISYGVRRCEFDHYLLNRCGATIHQGMSASSIERLDDGWIVNGSIRARLLVGAGGHFCPVARCCSTQALSSLVVAQETEFEMDQQQQRACPVNETVPELYFCPDLKGYGWCFRKGRFLNIGLGRADSHGLRAHVDEFLRALAMNSQFFRAIPRLHGHAYLLYGSSPRPLSGDRFLLIGDSAGLAYPYSGEGILTAIESGLAAAGTIVSARRDYTAQNLTPYATDVAHRLGSPAATWMMRLGNLVPTHWIQSVATRLISKPWFVRHVLLERCFLHL